MKKTIHQSEQLHHLDILKVVKKKQIVKFPNKRQNSYPFILSDVFSAFEKKMVLLGVRAV